MGVGVIEFHQVYKTYAHEYRALRNVSLTVARGEFVFVTGPSGAGKSTLLKLLTRELCADQGSVLVDDKNVGKLKGRQLSAYRRKIGVVFQDFRLLFDRTVFDNVAIVLHVCGVANRRITQETNAALERVGLIKKRLVKPWHLSGGEMQRVVLARAIVHDPMLILADEPTGNLDFETGWAVMQLLQHVSENGTTVLCTTHNQNFIQKMKKRTIMLDQGAVCAVREP
jgi:cell division transport system ATP-binding protein